MKKIGIIALLASVALASCNKEAPEAPVTVPSDGNMVYTSFTAGGEDLTKVVLNFAEGKNMQWLDSDVIAVFDGVSKNTFTVKQGSNTGATAEFEGTVDAGASTLYAVYPESAAAGLDGSSLSVTVPEIQTIAEGACADPAALLSVASAPKGSGMAFKQVCGLLKVSITDEDIRFIMVNGKAIAGTAKVAADGTLSSVSDPVDCITLSHADGLFPPGTYYVALLPGTIPAGNFSLALISDSRTRVKEASGSVTFSRCKGLDAGPLNGMNMYTAISNMPELFNWNANRVVNEESEEEHVVLLADIDMDSEAWKPKDFKGVFDGRGHKLYNLNVSRSSNACLFNTLAGTIKDLTVGTKDGSSYDGASCIVQDNTEDSGESWRYAGLITRLAEGSVMENVVNYASVTVASTSLSKTRVGGLVAIVAGNATIKDCANFGSVTNAAAAPLGNGAVGGLVGWTDAPVNVIGSVNAGDVTVDNANTLYLGGILSYDANGSTLDNCVNKGDVAVTSTGSCGMCIGGILGDGSYSKIKNCDNNGALSTVCDGELKIGGILGRALNGCTVTNCSNHDTGTISYNTVDGTKRAFIGGIVGNSPAANAEALTITGCTNYASISTDKAQTACIGGIGGFINGAGVTTIKDCENKGDIANTNANALNGSTAAAAYVSGIVAYLNTSLADGSSIDGCINRGNISSENRNIINIAGIIPLLQTANSVSVKDCHNYGTIMRNSNIRTNVKSGDNYDTAYSIGGIAGQVNAASASITGCVNHESSIVWANAGGGSANPRVGGIVGYIRKCGSIENCTNEGDVIYDNVATGGSYTAVGGIVGHCYNTTVFNACTNSGGVSSNRTQVNRVGGIVGTANKTPVTNCTNEGAVMVVSSVQTANWQSVGGIAGFAEGSEDNTLDFIGNVNRGSVSATANTTNARFAVGGVIGMSYSSFNVSNNRNYGSVTGKNTNDSTPYCYVGGISGQESSAGNISVFGGNVNYGDVSNETGNAGYSVAGGIFGEFGKAPSASGSNFGSVTAGKAGAVAGINKSVIVATLCDAVQVNGVTKAAAADEALWLCPNNTGTITPTYTAHSTNE